MNNKTSTSILVIAVIVAVLSTAFGLSSMTTYAAPQSRSSETTYKNGEQHDSNSHSPTFAANRY